MHCQKQLSKQKQLIDQSFSNNIMLNVLSALEDLAFFYGYKGKKIFGYYSGDSNKNDENALINAVIIQLQVYRASHSSYLSEFSEYHFPRNLSQKDILIYLSKMKAYIPREDVGTLYDEMIRYISGNSSYSGISDIVEQKKKEWGPTSKYDLQRISKSSPYVNTNMFNQIEEVKNSYEKNGNYEINALLYKNKEENKLMQDLSETNKRHEFLLNEFLKNEADIENLLDLIIKKIENKMDFSKEDYEIKLLIQKFNSYGIELGKEDVKDKINKYDTLSKKAFSVYKTKNNPISSYCQLIIEEYKKNIHEYKSYK